MTRKESIEQLESIMGTYEILMGHGVNSDILGADDIEAIRKAIEVLKEEQCEDCTDREELISRAEENRRMIEHLETEAEKIDEGFDEVMELAYIYNILTDISKSLAEISDKIGNERR